MDTNFRAPVWLALAAIGGLSTSAWAEEWETVATGPIMVKARAVAGSSVKEFWAEGEMAAPVQDIQTALMDHARFPFFMPYVKESRVVGEALPDGSEYVYTRLEVPMITSRDYILRVHLVESVREDGTGNFRNQWTAVTDLLPERANVVRLRVNEGGWFVTPREDGRKSWVVYRFRVDPGGWMPSFIASMGNKTGVSDTFSAVEKEAKRRFAERIGSASP